VTHILHPEQGSSNPDWLPLAGGPTHTHCIDRHIINQPKNGNYFHKTQKREKKRKKTDNEK